MNDPLDVLRDKHRVLATIKRLFIVTDNRDWVMVRRCSAASVLFGLCSLGAAAPTQLTPEQPGPLARGPDSGPAGLRPGC